MTKHIIFYFDFISAYSYLAWVQFPKLLEETKASMEAIPVFLAGMLHACGQKGPAEIPSKRNYCFKDILMCAAECGVPIEGPPSHPFNPLLALRMCTALSDENQKQKLIHKMFTACWSEGKNIADANILSQLANECGLDGQLLLQKAQESTIKEQLKKNTEAALKKGVFGVPTFLVNGELFWGNDRLHFLKRFLKEGKPLYDIAKASELLSRPQR